MATAWTPERRAEQAALIRNWLPERSTGPKSSAGKVAGANNAYKAGFVTDLRALRKEVNAKIWAALDLLRGIKL